MNLTTFPQSYRDWHHCITVECGLEFTPEFISMRLATLQDAKDVHTLKFIELYGEQYLQQVIVWFKQAQESA